jgi:hypothetical protein
MTIFEYLTVAVSIVLSLGAVRLLDALPAVLDRDRRYWIHAVWIFNILWLHAQFWWAFWSYHSGVSWTYPRFLLALAAPALLYQLTVVLVSSEARAVPSWRTYFFNTRSRFFSVLAGWTVIVAAHNIFLLGFPLVHPIRIAQGILLAICLVGATSAVPRVHAALALLFTSGLVYSLLYGFYQPAPLAPLR